MRINDAIIGLALLVGAGLLWLYAGTLPPMSGQAYGAGLFPAFIAVGLAATAGWLILETLRAGGGGPAIALAPWARSPRRLLALALAMALVLFYILGSERLGFIPTAFVVVAALLAILGVRPWAAAALGAVVTLGVHQVFYKLLLVPLPWGLLTPLAW